MSRIFSSFDNAIAKRPPVAGAVIGLICLGGFSGLVSCSKKSEGTGTAPPEAKNEAAWCRVSLVENPSQTPESTVHILDRLPISRGRVTSPFGIIVNLSQLPPSWKGGVTCNLEDPSGKNISPSWSNPLAFAASDVGTGWIFLPVPTDPPECSAGTWKLNVDVPGLGNSSHLFQIDPPTDSEKAALADHEEAKRYALKAFSNFWVVFPHKDLKNTYITATKAEKPTTEVLGQFNLFQAARLKFTCTQDHLSDADKLNGISYRGQVGFGFSLYRSYSPEKKWEEWKDLDAANNVIQAGLNQIVRTNYSAPGRYQQAPFMRFTVQKRDGNWILTSKEKARFINGVRNDDSEVVAERKKIQDEAQEKKLAQIRKGWADAEARRERRMNSYGPVIDIPDIPDSPASYFADELARAETAGELFSGDIFQPSLAVVSQIVDERATKRADLKNIASELKLTPETSKQQQEATIAALEE